MNLSNRTQWLLSLTFSLACACSGSNTPTVDAAKIDGGATQLSLAMQMASITPAAVAPKFLTKENSDGSFTPDNTNLTVSAATLTIDAIRIKLPEGLGCDASGFVAANNPSNVTCSEELDDDADGDAAGSASVEAKITVTGPFVLDLIAGTSTPTMDNIVIPSGFYREIEADASHVTMNGVFVDATAISHDFSLDVAVNKELEIDDCLQLEEGKVNAFVAAININSFFPSDLADYLEHGDLTFAGDGSLVIDDSSDSGVRSDIEDGLESAFEMVTDDNGDGHNDACGTATDDSSTAGADDGTADQGSGNL